MVWKFRKASNNLIFAENAETGEKVRFCRKNAKSAWEATGKGLTVNSQEFLDFAPKARAGRPKKFEDGKGFFIRVPAALHQKLLKCNADNLRKALEDASEIEGKVIVIADDFSSIRVENELQYLAAEYGKRINKKIDYYERTGFYCVNGELVEKLDKTAFKNLMFGSMPDLESDKTLFYDKNEAFEYLIDGFGKTKVSIPNIIGCLTQLRKYFD